ncbi:hypothetical protein DWV00_27365 [Trinickia dinghuensis]|uniref:Uncharacterized protein n=1 Tax=Trinickia dinghuensis TaxID=2291023 RepID=A0A3D8JRH6_9BURK|nr:hypothetical protein DWV00_27365 [Trinickia dinghuensis]
MPAAGPYFRQWLSLIYLPRADQSGSIHTRAGASSNKAKTSKRGPAKSAAQDYHCTPGSLSYLKTKARIVRYSA